MPLALVQPDLAAKETDFARIEKNSASLAEMAGALGMGFSAVANAAARGRWMTHQYPSQKQRGKLETRVLLSQLKQQERTVWLRVMRMRRQMERESHGLPAHHGGLVVRPDDGRLKISDAERNLLRGIYLSPEYGRPDVAGVFDHLKGECIRCKQRGELRPGALRPIDPRFAGRYKLHRCSIQDVSGAWVENPACGFALSYHTVRRELLPNKLPRAAQALAREGVNAMVNQFGYYMKRDWSGFVPNEEVFGDNHPCDVYVYDQREPYLRGGGAKLFRPQMSAWQDIATGGVAVRIGEHANADTLALSMRAYILRWGKPAGIVTDNGSDYLSRDFGKFCEGLHIAIRRPEGDQCNILPRNGRCLPSERGGESRAKGKPIERFFGSFARDFDKQQPGWCGAKPEEKPPQMFLWEKQHDEFLAGRSDSTPFLTIDRYIELAMNWIEQSFHKLPSRRLDRAPNDVHAAYRGPIDRVPERDLDILLMPPVSRVIGRRGVVIDHRDYYATGTFDQNPPGMVGIEGAPCQVRVDPGDISKAVVIVGYKDLPLSVRNVPGKELVIVAYHDKLLGKGATKEDAQESHRRDSSMRRFHREYIRAMGEAACGVDTIDQVLAEKAAREGVPQLSEVVNGVPVITAGAHIRAEMQGSIGGTGGTGIRKSSASSASSASRSSSGPRFSSDIARMVLQIEEE